MNNSIASYVPGPGGGSGDKVVNITGATRQTEGPAVIQQGSPVHGDGDYYREVQMCRAREHNLT